MSSSGIQVESLYAKDANLKREDVQILQEWLKKQPHLPQLEEKQIAMALHSCYYSIEAAKTSIDNYFTVRTHCPEVFDCLTPEAVKANSSVAFISVLPKTTPEGYAILLIKLIDFKAENYNCVQLLRLANMVITLHLHQKGFDKGAIALFDLKGLSLGHLARLNLTAIKHLLYQVQEGMPVRIKGIHVINPVPFTDKVVALVKPFLKNELYNMLHFHPASSDTLFKTIPKECLPEDYDGAAPSCKVLQETNLKNLLDNHDFFKWHDAQKVDESKRTGRPKNVDSIFGVEGTFKKLEID